MGLPESSEQESKRVAPHAAKIAVAVHTVAENQPPEHDSLNDLNRNL
jgi:hypothetical protein